MFCIKCGGEIRADKPCTGCGMKYDEMMDSISHEDLIRLFERIEELESGKKSTELEQSLLACELLNSHLLVCVEIMGETLHFASTPDVNGNQFIMLFTDRAEYDKVGFKKNPVTVPFEEYVKIVGRDCAGFVVNVRSSACCIPVAFLEKYFGGYLCREK